MRDGEDVRGHRKRRPRHEERRHRHRRRHSRSGRDERRLTRPILRARPQPRPLDARDDGGSKLRSRLCHGARALLLGRRRGASCLRFGRARHHARSPWVTRREHQKGRLSPWGCSSSPTPDPAFRRSSPVSGLGIGDRRWASYAHTGAGVAGAGGHPATPLASTQTINRARIPLRFCHGIADSHERAQTPSSRSR